MVAPGRHGSHVFEGLAFDLLARRARVAAGLPGGHAREPLLERLELAGVVGAMTAVAAGLDRHAAAFRRGRRVHGVLPGIFAGSGGGQRTGPGRAARPAGRRAERDPSVTTRRRAGPRGGT